MTPEVKVTAKAQPIPEKSSVIEEMTWKVPHILKSISLGEDGFTHREVREGGLRQVQFEVETDYALAPVDETPFAIRATNQLNFAGGIIDVLNDEVLLADGFRLVPTSPTASEYLAQTGKKTLIAFRCQIDNVLTKQERKSIYRISRVFVTLP